MTTECTASVFSGSGRPTHLLGSCFSNKTLFLSNHRNPQGHKCGLETAFSHPQSRQKEKFGRGELCCSPPSSSNLPVGQYILCPQLGDPPLEIALPLPRPSWFPEPKPFPQVPLTSSCQNSVLFQCPGPVIPHPKDFRTHGHKHGITPDHGRGGSAFRAKTGCPLHS